VAAPRTHVIRASAALWLAFAGSVQALAPATAAPAGLREAAVGLERTHAAKPGETASERFVLPLAGGAVVLAGQASLEALSAGNCRRVVELTHDQPFERRGLTITNLSRRSVQEGPCRGFAGALASQARASAESIAAQIGVDATGPAAAAPLPATRQLVAQVGGVPRPEAAPAAAPAPVRGAAVTLTVLEKALIRDAPSKRGEKLSKADAGTRLAAHRIPGNDEWFVLDGGLRFISASVVDATDLASARTTSEPARSIKAASTGAKTDAKTDAKTSQVRLKVTERAVLRDAPSFQGQRVASLGAGTERVARKVPGGAGWFELLDSASHYPLYIHASVVAENRL